MVNKRLAGYDRDFAAAFDSVDKKMSSFMSVSEAQITGSDMTERFSCHSPSDHTASEEQNSRWHDAANEHNGQIRGAALPQSIEAGPGLHMKNNTNATRPKGRMVHSGYAANPA